MLLTIPAGLALMVLSGPLVALLFQHGFGLFQGGAFSEAATDITQAALIFYAVGLFAHAAIEILSRGFYALGDTRTPVLYAVVAVVANLILSAALVGPLEIKGLALALSLATVIEVTLLFAALRLRLQGLDLRSLARSLFKTLLAALLMVEVAGFYLVLLHETGHLDTNRLLDSTLAVAGATLLGGLVYVAVAKALGSEEVETLLSRLPLPARMRP